MTSAKFHVTVAILCVVVAALGVAVQADEPRTCLTFCERAGADASQVWEGLVQVPELWVRNGPAAPDATTLVMVGVTTDHSSLERKFFSVSEPCNDDYRNYWTQDELVREVAADKADVARVTAWLEQSGATEVQVTATGDWVEAQMSASAVEAAFGVAMESFSWRGPGSDVVIVRTVQSASVPSMVSESVRAVVGLHEFPLTLGEARTRKGGVSIGAPHVTPQLLYKHYNVTEAAPSGTKFLMAVSEFEHETYSETDLKAFQKKFSLLEQPVTKVVGDGHGRGATESQLDIDYIMAMGQNVPSELWEQSGAFNLVKWLQDVLGDADVPLVWSTSYGEAIETIDVSVAVAFNAEQQKAATLGVSLVYASGDSGVYSRGEPQTSFYPTYPASLPANTAIGATQMDSSGNENSAVDWSGGGFSPSRYFTAAKDAPWQINATQGYLHSGVSLPPVSKYDSTGVGFPDASTLGVGFIVVFGGIIPEPVSGTSCASPTYAGIIALINSHIMAEGHAPLGFLNPWMYSHMAAFRDITQGKNSDGTDYGFEATTGWDPLTGVGVPKYEAMLEAARNPTAHCRR